MTSGQYEWLDGVSGGDTFLLHVAREFGLTDRTAGNESNAGSQVLRLLLYELYPQHRQARERRQRSHRQLERNRRRARTPQIGDEQAADKTSAE